MDRRTTFFSHSASIFKASQIDWEHSMAFPSAVETNITAQKQIRPTSPSVTTSPSMSAQAVPSSSALVTATQTPDPDILALKEQLAELRTIIQVQQQQLPPTTAPPAPNPPATSFPPDFATTMLAAISSLRAEIAELRNLHLPISTPSSTRKKVHFAKEPHLLYRQQAWLKTYEPMIRRRTHARDRVTQQRLPITDE
jgi:hypothetical protein